MQQQTAAGILFKHIENGFTVTPVSETGKHDNAYLCPHVTRREVHQIGKTYRDTVGYLLGHKPNLTVGINIVGSLGNKPLYRITRIRNIGI